MIYADKAVCVWFDEDDLVWFVVIGSVENGVVVESPGGFVLRTIKEAEAMTTARATSLMRGVPIYNQQTQSLDFSAFPRVTIA
jgi:hypothetical protein